MEPAFSSTRQAVGFSLLLAVILALPAVAAGTGWFRMTGRYPYIPDGFGAFSVIEHRIFARTNAVDVAFVGSSHLWSGIDTPAVADQFRRRLHREAEVITLGWNFTGYDLLYFIAHDLLEQRSVKMLVIDDETQKIRRPGQDVLSNREHSRPHRLAAFWYYRGEDLAAVGLLHLPPVEWIAWYGGAVLDMPRYLVDCLRPDPPPITDGSHWLIRAVIADRGALRVTAGWNMALPFLPYDPAQYPANPADAVVYSAATRAAFAFVGPAWDDYERYFAGKLVRLCQEKGTQLVVLHLPLPTESRDSTIPEPHNWPEDFAVPVALLGVPGGKLFSEHTANQVRSRFFYDEWHMNRNGEDLFTPPITSALIKLYDNPVRRF